MQRFFIISAIVGLVLAVGNIIFWFVAWSIFRAGCP